MSQEKAQLIAPIGIMTVSGMTATGFITATSFSGNVVGSAKSLVNGTDVDVGVMTATSFAGNLTGNIQRLADSAPDISAGVTTATSFVGNLTGSVTDLTSQPAITVRLIAATSLSGPITGNVTGNITGNVTGLAASITPGSNLGVGVCTAIQYHGDGSGLTGAGSSAYIAQEVTATGAETIIDLSYGNVIYYKGVATTVGFASTSAAEQITFIRDTSSTFDSSYNISYSTGGVTMDGTDDNLNLAASGDFECAGDFTIECWFNSSNTGSNRALFGLGAYNVLGGVEMFIDDGVPVFYTTNSSNTAIRITGSSITTSQWYHLAVVRSGTTVTMYLDGSSVGSYTDSTTFGNGSNNYFTIGAATYEVGGYADYWSGVISNFRFVKGTAVYTSTFIPPQAALTNITNTKLLCCQDTSSTTVGAVKPGTITANSSPTAGAQTVATSGTKTLSAGTITWPDRVKWNNDTTPTLFTNARSAASQIFRFTTVDTGLNYNAWEEIKVDSSAVEIWNWGRNSQGRLGLNQG